MHSAPVDVAIIGAGPYGLALAAHLRKRGTAFRIFGSPMQTWRELPRKMTLKSPGHGTSIPVPGVGHTFPEYCRAGGLDDSDPIAFETFAQYGMHIQRSFVPEVEDTRVTHLSPCNDKFAVGLESGERVHAHDVVIATGLTYFARMPAVLAHLPPDHLSHTWGPKLFGEFARLDVVVVGGGSSALETAVLLHEHGAGVQVLARRKIDWGIPGPSHLDRTLIDRIRLPMTSMGHGRKNWVLENVPWLLHYLPARMRLPFTRSHLGPLPAWWLRDRAEGKFPIFEGHGVISATAIGGKVQLRVRRAGSADACLTVDHVIAGTGYEVDVDRIPFLDRELACQIQRWERAPRLSRNFESSVKGLYFLGPAAAASFGPLFRFVAGASYAVPRVAARLSRSVEIRRLKSARLRENPGED